MRNMNDILRQAQVMQQKIAKLQQEMGDHDFEAASGGGMVKAVVSGKQELRRLTIAPQGPGRRRRGNAAGSYRGCVNEAGRIARESMEREMSSISGGIKLPGMF